MSDSRRPTCILVDIMKTKTSDSPSEKPESLFVILEGIDESGKTTHGKWIAENYDCVYTFEPGGYGNSIREMVLTDKTSLSPRAEALMFAADRAQHVERKLADLFARKENIVCDRYVPSSVAYQGWGRGLGAEEVLSLSLFSCSDIPFPDLTIWLDLPYSEYAARAKKSGKRQDQFSDETEEFYAAVAAGYQSQYDSRLCRWEKIDAARPMSDVRSDIAAALDSVGFPKRRYL